MAIKLKETDVVIIGLGAAGGIAALPLVQAGLEVVGLEAGTWLTKRDFAPDELRNNYRGWPQAVQKANLEVPTHRPSASAPYSPRPAVHPMMNAVGGTTLHYWAQSWRLNPWDFKVVSETARRYGSGRIPKGSTVEDWPFGYEELEPYYEKVEYEIGVSGKAGNLNGKVDPAGKFSGAAQARVSNAATARHRIHRTDGRRRARPRLATVSWPRRGQFAAVPEPRRLRIPRLLQSRRLPRGREKLDRGDDNSKGRGNGAPSRSHARPCHPLESDREGRVSGVAYLVNGVEYFQPAKAVLLASYIYENVAAAPALEVEALSERVLESPRPGRKTLLQPQPGRERHGAFPLESQQLVRPPGPGRRRGQLGRRQLRSLAPGFYRRRKSLGLLRPQADRCGQHGHIWQSARHGARPGKRSSKKTPTAGIPPTCKKPRLPYEDNYLDLDPTVKDPLGFPVCRITADYKDNEHKLSAFIQDKMERWYKAAGAIATIRNPAAPWAPRTHALWRHAHGRQSRNKRRKPLGLFARSAEPRNPGRFGDGNKWRSQSDANPPGACLANGRASGAKLEQHRQPQITPQNRPHYLSQGKNGCRTLCAFQRVRV